MPIAIDEVRTYRAKYAALTRDRDADDPELIAARNGLFLAQRNAGAHAALNALEARVSGAPPATVLEALRCRDVPIEVRLVQAVELLTYLARAASDRPLALVAALREQVDRIDATGLTAAD